MNSNPEQPSSRPWRPSSLILGSVALHLFAVAAVVTAPGTWPGWGAVVLLDHLVLAVASLQPRNRWLGPNRVRLEPAAVSRREVALTFDDGPDPRVTPQVLALLADAGVRATFFPIGARAEAQPELMGALVQAGHRVENHSYRHGKSFAWRPPARVRREIDRAQQALHETSGRAPRLFRAPAGVRSPWLDFVLARTGLELVSWTARGFDTRERDPDRVLARLTGALEPGAILLLHDAGSAVAPTGRPVVLEVLPRLLEEIRNRSLVPVVLDP